MTLDFGNFSTFTRCKTHPTAQVYQKDLIARNFVDRYGKAQIYQVKSCDFWKNVRPNLKSDDYNNIDCANFLLTCANLWAVYVYVLFNRPGVPGAVLQTPLSFIH